MHGNKVTQTYNCVCTWLLVIDMTSVQLQKNHESFTERTTKFVRVKNVVMGLKFYTQVYSAKMKLRAKFYDKRSCVTLFSKNTAFCWHVIELTSSCKILRWLKHCIIINIFSNKLAVVCRPAPFDAEGSQFFSMHAPLMVCILKGTYTHKFWPTYYVIQKLESYDLRLCMCGKPFRKIRFLNMKI